MKALVKTGGSPEDIELQDNRECVALPASGHARVRVVASGICGTDLHILDGSYMSAPPVTLGHEVSGVVETVSRDVDKSWIGEPVALETFWSTCGACNYCRSGRPNMCDARISIGSGADGGFAESIVIPVCNLHVLPGRVPVALGALVEPLACVCQSLFDPFPAVSPGDRVLVIGPGAVGLLAAQVARAGGGVVTIAGLERDRARLDVAANLGFATVVSPVDRNDLPDGYGDGPQVVVECSGSEFGMSAGLHLIRKRGRYVQMGQSSQPSRVPLSLVSFKELVVTGGFASRPASWARAMTLLEDGAVELNKIGAQGVPLSEWHEAFEATGRGDGVKYLLLPGSKTQ